ncbi:pro-corazonin [Danaus plexippus]|uniref:pro-corazonin n=1 Tax=Danaus plexippus TaxID=13037 RepID=UPI002AB116C1|nr:pro-corazonin [Danaus plexippus]XP_061380032.1 pro-corazonin [Danaus plexippus]
MSRNIALLLILVTLSSAASQTFQYSRGWTNGKRDGSSNDLQKILSPCQMHKLRALLRGRSLTDSLLEPCGYYDQKEQTTNERKSLKANRESLYDVFQ